MFRGRQWDTQIIHDLGDRDFGWVDRKFVRRLRSIGLDWAEVTVDPEDGVGRLGERKVGRLGSDCDGLFEGFHALITVREGKTMTNIHCVVATVNVTRTPDEIEGVEAMEVDCIRRCGDGARDVGHSRADM
jgi:hypothetical protein